MTVAMEKRYDFDGLFVFDLANNHQGSVSHGTAIIQAVGETARRHGVRGAMKFQFRQLDSFIHPTHREGSDNKHIPRFLSTRLARSDFESLLSEVRKAGLIPMVTPFDEGSVDVALEMGFEILKIASCSGRDWPLIERIAAAGKPVVFSTGGLTIEDVDNLVSFLEHRAIDFAIMHCVSIYPTPDALCQLNHIERLVRRYSGHVVGWSTHEDPNDTVPIQMAYAKGARVFERHVGIATNAITPNAYSSTPAQLDRWLAAHAKAVTLCGNEKERPIEASEQSAIDGLQRGVYARTRIRRGLPVQRNQVYFAMPYVEGSLASGQWEEGIVASVDIETDGPLLLTGLEIHAQPKYQVIKTAVHEVKGMLNEARITLSPDFEVEYSHHYGVERFRETGCVLISCVNREYCKKLIVQLPNQSHPYHFHRRKEETFQVLHGEMYLEREGQQRLLKAGETAIVMPGVWHRFWTDKGAIVEEISTTHHDDDSIYRDPVIQRQTREQRKTVVDHWGRFELNDTIEGPHAEDDESATDPRSGA